MTNSKISNEKLTELSKKDRFGLLSEREQTYFNIMDAKAGVLYITSRPGLAKSSIAREIARIMGYQYVDIRLSIADETDFGMPKLKEMTVDGIVYDVHNMTVPGWAIKANSKPTIIHFEELNRCSLNVRNACLGVLLERTIGPDFKFNGDVLMIASGNLGEEDGTDTEEFDAALNNRLIHVKHDLLAPEWIEQFAKYSVHPLIVGFIKSHPEYLYKKDGSDNGEMPKAFATPRTWTHLSEFILNTLGREDQMDNKFDIPQIQKLLSGDGDTKMGIGGAYIGTSIRKFITYLTETMNLTLDNILDDFPKYKNRLLEVNRDKRSELLAQLQEKDLKKLKAKQVKNLVSFLNEVDEDERAGFLTYIIDKRVDEEVEEPEKTILLSFKNLITKISDMS